MAAFRLTAPRSRIERAHSCGTFAAAAAVCALLASACSSSDAADLSQQVVATTPQSTLPTETESETTEPLTTPESPPSTEPSATTGPAAPERDFSALAPVIESFVADNQLNGAGLIVVDRSDGIVHEEYVGEFDRDRVSLIASSSKMITAGVLLRLADDGLIDLDAPVASAVPWGAANPDVTPAQLVSNSSGLVGLLPQPGYEPYGCQWSPTAELEACGISVFETADDDGDVVAPDTEFRYGGAQWQVAGALAEEVTGKTWAELITEIYVEPCGVESLGYANHWSESPGFSYPADFDPATLTPTENPNMEGGAYITPPDYAELLLMHLRGGVCDNGRVLSEEAVARAHADRVAEAYGEAGASQPGYGFGWWVDRTTGIISDGGAYGSLPWLDLDDGYGAYLVIEANSGLGSALFRELAPLVDEAMVSA